VTGTKRKPSPLMGAAAAMLDGVADAIVREGTRFRHSMEVPLDRIHPDPDQPRKVFDDSETAALARTMAEQGQLQAILVRRDPDVRGRWLIVAGERRWRAAQANGWNTILAIEHTGDAEVATLVENLQRVDLAAVEEARGLQRLISGKGWSQKHAAQVLGKAEAEISSTLRILTLPTDLLGELLATKESGPSRYVLAELARVEAGPARDRLIAAARAGELTQRMIRAVRGDDTMNAPVPKPRGGGRSNRLSFKAVDRIADGLRTLREGGGKITEVEKDRLVRLRGEIDGLLRSRVRR
jgi:ParB family chromosome partitioning protein